MILHILNYLTLVGENGITLTPNKLQFSQKVVQFAGFVVGKTTVKPLPKYLDAIRNFERPTTISEARSWFGLVNQVSRYGRLAEIIYPFKERRSSYLHEITASYLFFPFGTYKLHYKDIGTYILFSE